MEQDHSFDVWWDQKKVEFDQMSGMDIYNFLHMVSSAGRTNSNSAWQENRSWWSNGSGWKIKSNLAWQEIEVDNLMEVDEKSNLILFGKK